MGLEGDGAFVELAGEAFAGLGSWAFGVGENDLAVDPNGDRIAFDRDVLLPPFVILCGGDAEIGHVVEAAGFLPVFVRNVDLAFEANFGPIGFLILGVEINAAVAVGLGHDVDLELEVFKWFFIAHIKEVAAFAASDQSAVFDFPRIRVLRGFLPAIESLTIKDGLEAIIAGGVLAGEGKGGNGEEDTERKEGRFHRRDYRREGLQKTNGNRVLV